MPAKPSRAPRICRHISTTGSRCGSPALRERPYCFHHQRLHAQNRILHVPPADQTILHPMQLDGDHMQRNPIAVEPARPAHITLQFPPLEDRESVQVAISMILAALAQNRVDPKIAKALLYGMQVASANAKGLRGSISFDSVRRVTVDEYGTELAPEDDPS